MALEDSDKILNVAGYWTLGIAKGLSKEFRRKGYIFYVRKVQDERKGWRRSLWGVYGRKK